MKKNNEFQSNDLVTKGYLDKVFDKYFDKIAMYIDFKIKPLEEMSQDYYKFKDHVNKTLDWLVGAYQKFDEEYLIMSTTHTEMNDVLDNHEKRISLLERYELRKKKLN